MTWTHAISARRSISSRGSSSQRSSSAAPYLFPPAHDFGQGRFRLVTTQSGAPSEGDLVATLRRGIPGSAMPAWSWLADEDFGALANYVRFLAEVGIVERDEADVPRYQRLLAELRPSERADRITVEGVQAMSSAHRVAGEVVASAHWEPDAWSVTFTRPLRAHAVGEVEFQPGQTLQIACAIWNGACGDGGARKSISIWQRLVLDP